MSESFSRIPVRMLVYSGRNPRYEMRGLEQLAGNVEQYGVLQPIIVRPKGEKFEVVIGERRLRASIMAGLREVPAIVREISDREADELCLIENIHRDDLTDAEKGDAIYGLMERHPGKYRSVADVARALNLNYKVALNIWCRQSRKISSHVRETISLNLMKDYHAMYLLKYDHTTQDKLADAIVRNKIPTTTISKFIKLFDENPKADLDELANQAKGVKKVEVEVAKLPPKIRKEVKKIVEERKAEVKKARKKALKKGSKAPRRPRPKQKPVQVRPLVIPEVEVPSVPSMTTRLPSIEEELQGLLGSSIERLRKEAFATREEAFERIKKVLEEPVRAREERKMVKEIDTGIIEECPLCHKKFRIIHHEPPISHKCEEIRE